ncbi:hypothetical protein CONPUDRAFT_158934 [Coniophora puteana RWD-64-598 SS2]|uniref:Uncharacterized protein n=1 Tax=Coniophora puteana (strain RWD-64-598) TaxID=741705 RepID=A0A5M3M873_CONPW|nr:uncharacterized protein CONPUDRAFT_158934 [Coniophora puteana RWD-64-598 SS2]EIW75472.1 hypothetical protein CONPUDRAFT_158934 [Coniophora puteana RWD-64-598 SS2]
MAIRLHALYGQSRAVLRTLLVCFVIEQSICLATHIIAYYPGNGLTVQAGNFSGQRFCVFDGPRKATWALPANNAALLTYEVMLAGFTLHRFVTHLLSERRYHEGWLGNHFLRILYRDNVLYSMLTLSTMTIIEISYAPVFKSVDTGLAADFDTNAALYTYLLCVMGPHMILSIRQHDTNDMASNTTDTFEMHRTYIEFAQGSGMSSTLRSA